ncbi:hypothetical protein L208DRAFT_1412841 [Tricholoma matsutake]|nr:hypothetical protein L208DRAFT_1412841 [Tricholoma matsutake 945]
MPIYTAGGTVRIEGVYNDVGHDMYTYAGDTHQHVNSHNLENTSTTGSYNDSSLNKASQNASAAVESRAFRSVEPLPHEVDDADDELPTDVEEGGDEPKILEHVQLPVVTSTQGIQVLNLESHRPSRQRDEYEPKKRFWTPLSTWFQKGRRGRT